MIFLLELQQLEKFVILLKHARRMMEEYELKPLVNLYYDFYKAIHGREAPSIEVSGAEPEKSTNPFASRVSGIHKMKSSIA